MSGLREHCPLNYTPTLQKNQVALKLIDKREYRSTKTRRRINSEITNMKLVQDHQNIISVFESKLQSKFCILRDFEV